MDWGFTSDGLLSVVVTNTGTTIVASAHAIISGVDAYGNTVASVSAPGASDVGKRCCTIISLAPNARYGLYSFIGPRSATRVKNVTVQYTDVRLSATRATSPVSSLTNAALTVDGSSATARVTVATTKTAGPFITVQAFLNGPSGKFFAVISGGFYCIPSGTTRTIDLQFFHPVPTGSSVQSVIAFPLDAATARIEGLKTCNAG